MRVMSAVNGMSFIDGLFSNSIIVAIASLAGHLIYGMVLGKLYGQSSQKKILVEKLARDKTSERSIFKRSFNISGKRILKGKNENIYCLKSLQYSL